MEPVNVRVKYLGKSKRNFAVRPNGVEYKFKPGEMTHLSMPKEHADALIAERPDLWGIDTDPAYEVAGIDTGAPGSDRTVVAEKRGDEVTVLGDAMSVDELLKTAHEGSKAYTEKRKRRDETEGG